MKISLRFVILAAVMGLSACTPARSVNQLTDAQRDTAQLVVQQAEQIELQRQQLLALQQERGQILQELTGLRQDVENLRRTGAAITPPRETKSAVGKHQRNVKNTPTRSHPQFDESGKVILGKEEWVWFDLLGRSVKTKVDTGVKSSMIYTSDIQLFERDGDQWVRFALAIDSNGGLSADAREVYEAPLLRRVKTRPVNGGETESRPIVRLKMKLGELIDDSEFVLMRRDNNEFPVVLGRSFLRDIAVVDVARKYTQNKNSESSPL